METTFEITILASDSGEAVDKIQSMNPTATMIEYLGSVGNCCFTYRVIGPVEDN